MFANVVQLRRFLIALSTTCSPGGSCPLGYLVAFLVFEGADDDHDQVDRDPDSQPAKREELDDPSDDLAGVIAVYAGPSDTEAKKQRGQNALFALAAGLADGSGSGCR